MKCIFLIEPELEFLTNESWSLIHPFEINLWDSQGYFWESQKSGNPHFSIYFDSARFPKLNSHIDILKV